MKCQAGGAGVVYVAGYGRSGSTLLDAVLGNHAGIFGGGELTWLYQQCTAHGRCSCGAGLTDCHIWRSVVDRVLRTTRLHACAQAALLTRKTELLRGGGRASEDYVRLWCETFQAIRQTSGKGLVIDSSKCSRLGYYRLPLLAKHLDVPLRVVHLVRDPRAVMWSVHRGTNRQLAEGCRQRPWGGMARALLSWMFSNVVVERLSRRHPELPIVRVRYEDLVVHWRRTIGQLADFLETPLDDIAARIDRHAAFDPGHGVAGNRMRGQGAIVFHLDNQWETRLPQAARALSAIAWPLMAKYHYGSPSSVSAG